MTRVAHIMTPSPETISTTSTAEEAGRRMSALHLRHLPVVDDGGRLVGILSDRNLRGPMLGNPHAHPAPLASAPVGSLMTRTAVPPPPGPNGKPVRSPASSSTAGQRRARIVDADGVPIGIVGFVNVMRRLADEAEQDARAIDLMDR